MTTYICLIYVIFIGKMYTYKIAYKSTGDYMNFKMADVSLHLSLQLYYTILYYRHCAKLKQILFYDWRGAAIF